jgi:hypothetical protein
MIIAIALLCTNSNYPLKCQQSYVHCTSVKSITMTQDQALNKCIMEKK